MKDLLKIAIIGDEGKVIGNSKRRHALFRG